MSRTSHLKSPMETPAVVRGVFRERKVFDERGNAVELASNILESETALLHAAVRELRPDTSAEVGFAHGVSTLSILDALRSNGGGHHHVMDPFQASYGNCGRAMVRRADLESFYTFHERFADEVIPGLPRLQFAFIDSSHLFDLTIAEFVLCDRRLDVGGVIGLHDMWMPAQQAVARYILANRKYRVWQPAGWPAPDGGNAEPSWKRWLRGAAGLIPRAEQIFAKDFLVSWRELHLPNLLMLRKEAEDDRAWRFHERF